MSKQAVGLDLALPVRDAETPAYLWLYNSLRAEILDGRLRPGSRLPATRDLAAQHKLSRGTIVNAFEQLKAEGYVEGSVGSGTFVTKVLPEDLLKVRIPAAAADERSKTKAPRRKLSDYALRAKQLAGYEQRRFRAFRANVPAVSLFPIDVWAQLATRRLRNVTADQLLGCEAMGFYPLRQSVADYLNSSRGVNCTADQVAIVSGMQEALDLAARLFVNAGDTVGVENPGYVGAVGAFAAAGAKIVPVRLDDEGACVQDRALLGAKMIYITPAHQYPLGITMSLRRRLHLLEWARKNGTMIFEDDYDSEYRYCGKPIPALQSLDCTGQVIFAGSFSKVMFPAMRLGFMVVAPDLVERLSAVKSVSSQHSALLGQMTLCDFIEQGHFGRHIRRMREVYSARLDVLLEESRHCLAGLLETRSIEAGLQTTGWLCEGINEQAAARAAHDRGVEVIPLGQYTRGKIQRHGLQLGFAAIDPKEIRKGVQNLAQALESLRKR